MAGGHDQQQKLKESLFCVFLRPDKHKDFLGALGFPGGAGREGLCLEGRCHCQGAGEVLLRITDSAKEGGQSKSVEFLPPLKFHCVTLNKSLNFSTPWIARLENK